MGRVYICNVIDAARAEAARYGYLELYGTRRTVALKTMDTAFFESGENADRFRLESLIWITLPPHPNVVECLAVDLPGLIPIVVLEFAEGGSLRERLSRGFMTVTDALTLFREICAGLMFLAEQGISIHRDIKPENILLTRDGTAMVSDFGLASVRQVEQDRALGGTHAYMSPEHRAGKHLTTASDIYSFGVVMFEVFEGTRPAESCDRRRTPAGLVPIIEQCLLDDPRDRFANFNDLDRALEMFIQQERLNVRQPQAPISSGPDGAESVRRAHAYMQMDLLDGPLILLQRALELEPDAPSTNARMGILLTKLGRAEEAHAYIEREIAKHPDNPFSHRLVADFFIAQKQIDRAIMHLETAALLGSFDPSNQRLLAGCYRAEGRTHEFTQALERLKSEMAKDPDKFSAAKWVNEGLLLGQIGELHWARRFFEECVSLFPMSFHGWHNLAVTLLYLGEPQRALASVIEAQKVDSARIELYMLTGMVWYALGDGVRSTMAWQTVLAIDPQHRFAEVVPMMVAAVAASKSPREVMASSRRVLADSPISYFYYR